MKGRNVFIVFLAVLVFFGFCVFVFLGEEWYDKEVYPLWSIPVYFFYIGQAVSMVSSSVSIAYMWKFINSDKMLSIYGTLVVTLAMASLLWGYLFFMHHKPFYMLGDAFLLLVGTGYIYVKTRHESIKHLIWMAPFALWNIALFVLSGRFVLGI